MSAVLDSRQTPAAAAGGAASEQASMPALEVRGVERSFGALKTLKGVDLSIAPGQSVGLCAISNTTSRPCC